jgi:hypothetical protein
MVRLQIRCPVKTKKGRRLFTGLALVVCTSKDIGLYGNTPLIVETARFFGSCLRRFYAGLQGLLAELLKGEPL